MLQTKSILVTGNTVTRNGVREKDLGAKVDSALNKFLGELDGKFIDVKISTEFQGASGDYAFVTVIYEGEEKAKSKK